MSVTEMVSVPSDCFDTTVLSGWVTVDPAEETYLVGDLRVAPTDAAGTSFCFPSEWQPWSTYAAGDDCPYGYIQGCYDDSTEVVTCCPVNFACTPGMDAYNWGSDFNPCLSTLPATAISTAAVLFTGIFNPDISLIITASFITTITLTGGNVLSAPAIMIQQGTAPAFSPADPTPTATNSDVYDYDTPTPYYYETFTGTGPFLTSPAPLVSDAAEIETDPLQLAATTSITPSSTSTSTPPAPAPSLTPAAAAGLTLGAIAVVLLFVLGLLALFRRRRGQQRWVWGRREDDSSGSAAGDRDVRRRGEEMHPLAPMRMGGKAEGGVGVGVVEVEVAELDGQPSLLLMPKREDRAEKEGVEEVWSPVSELDGAGTGAGFAAGNDGLGGGWVKEG